MDEFHRQAAITALRVMFEGSHFSICTVDKCMKLSGCIANPKDYQALHALHCVDFAEMTQELRQMVLAKTMQIFENPKFDIGVISALFKADSKLLN